MTMSVFARLSDRTDVELAIGRSGRKSMVTVKQALAIVTGNVHPPGHASDPQVMNGGHGPGEVLSVRLKVNEY